MGLPKDLLPRSRKRLERKPPPTTAELIKGSATGPPLTDDQKEGFRVQALLAARADNEREAALTERRKLEANAIKAREDAIMRPTVRGAKRLADDARRVGPSLGAARRRRARSVRPRSRHWPCRADEWR